MQARDERRRKGKYATKRKRKGETGEKWDYWRLNHIAEQRVKLVFALLVAHLQFALLQNLRPVAGGSASGAADSASPAARGVPIGRHNSGGITTHEPQMLNGQWRVHGNPQPAQFSQPGTNYDDVAAHAIGTWRQYRTSVWMLMQWGGWGGQLRLGRGPRPQTDGDRKSVV